MRGYIETANVFRGQALALGSPVVFTRELPMGEGWYRAYLTVHVVVTIGTGAGAIADGLERFIRKVLFKTDRGEITHNLPARALMAFAKRITGAAAYRDDVLAASGTYRIQIPLIWADPSLARPEDCVLDTSRYASCALEVSTGSMSDLYTAPGNATAVVTADLDVERSFGPLPDGAKPYFHTSFDYRQPVDASSVTLIDLDKAPDMSIARLMVHSCSGGSAGVPFSGTNADDVQDVVTVKDENRFIIKERTHRNIQYQNKWEAGLEALMTGFEFFDFVADKSLASALATGGKSVLQYSWTNQAGVAANDLITLGVQAIRTLK